MATLSDLRVDAAMYEASLTVPPFLCRDPFPTAVPHFTVTLPKTIEEFFRGLPAKVRKNLNWEAKQLTKSSSGDVRVVCFQQKSELELMVRDIGVVASKTWQRSMGGGFEDTIYTRNRLGLVAEMGWLRTYVLHVAGKPCSFCVGILYARTKTYYTEVIGFDPAYAKFSPGTFLLMKILDDLCRNNVREVDFSKGFEEYKRRFSNRERREASVCLFAPTPRGIALRGLRAISGMLDCVTQKPLEQTGLLQRLRVWRRHASAGGPSLWKAWVR